MNELSFKLDEAAEAEFYNIVDYYKQFDRALSSDFIQEFDQAVQWLLNYPKAGSPYFHGTKRIILRRFPYSIVYKIYRNEVIIAHAIMHMRRRPDYWEERLQ